MGSDLDLPAIEVIFPALISPWLADTRFRSLGCRLVWRHLFAECAGAAVVRELLFGNPRWVAVECSISEQPCCRTGVVDDVEPQLPVVISNACPTADDLLELRHRADDTGEHDV